MPAVRTSKVKPAQVSRPRKERSIGELYEKSNGDSESDEATLEPKVEALRLAKAWSEIVELLDRETIFPLSSGSLQAAYCRAFYHFAEPSAATISRAETTSATLLKTKADSVDALLCAGKIAQGKGQSKEVADRALEAYKASGYKDDDALELLKSGHSGGAGARGASGAQGSTDSNVRVLHF